MQYSQIMHRPTLDILYYIIANYFNKQKVSFVGRSTSILGIFFFRSRGPTPDIYFKKALLKQLLSISFILFSFSETNSLCV